MIRLAENFFDAKNDPDQIAVDENVIVGLRAIHPRTMSEERDEHGPIAWILVIPTIKDLMIQFIDKKISEKEILSQTPLQARYEALYLCSALVLPEHRHKGIAHRLTVSAIKSLRQDHPITSLFYWSFSIEGDRLANAAAKESGLLLFKRDPE